MAAAVDRWSASELSAYSKRVVSESLIDTLIIFLTIKGLLHPFFFFFFLIKQVY